MKTLIIAASALAFATPALAQSTAAPTAVPPSSAPSTSTSPSTAMPQSDEPSTTGTNAPAPAADAASIIATEFPTYDKNGDGALNTEEFDSWMVALKAKSGAPDMKPAAKAAWLKNAFASADKDKNKAVSQAELTAYLTAGA